MNHLTLLGILGIWQIFLALFLIGFVVIWVKTIIEIAGSEFDGNTRVIWLLVVLFMGLLGLIIYYTVGRKQRKTDIENSADILE